MPSAAAARSNADPTIAIVGSALDKPLNPPLDIDVPFVAAGHAIRPVTFRV